MQVKSELMLSSIVAAAVFTATCGASSRATAPDGPIAPGTIVVLGDSLAVAPNKADAFPAVLEAKLTAAGLPWTVVNAGVSGDTTARGLARLDAAIAGNPQILVLALGANDGLRGIDTATVQSNLATIITRAKAKGIQVLLCGMEALPINGWDYTMRFHGIYPALARAQALPLVPFLLDGVAGNAEMNGDDLIHPNAAGARRIADNIWPFLEPMVRQLARTAVTAR